MASASTTPLKGTSNRCELPSGIHAFDIQLLHHRSIPSQKAWPIRSSPTSKRANGAQHSICVSSCQPSRMGILSICLLDFCNRHNTARMQPLSGKEDPCRRFTYARASRTVSTSKMAFFADAKHAKQEIKSRQVELPDESTLNARRTNTCNTLNANVGSMENEVMACNTIDAYSQSYHQPAIHDAELRLANCYHYMSF